MSILLPLFCSPLISAAAIPQRGEVYVPVKFGEATSFAGIHDFDRDGVPDVLIGNKNTAFGGSVYISSGKTGNMIWEFPEYGGSLGSAVAQLSDYDNDGVKEFGIGAPFANTANGFETGMIVVLSGATGNTLFNINGATPSLKIGSRLGNAGDVNGDGIDDIVSSFAQSATGWGGRVVVFSGLNHDILMDVGPAWEAIAPGDLDGDGYDDIVTWIAYLTGYVAAYSGRTGATLWTFGHYGPHICKTGDLDGDGLPEVIVSDADHNGGAIHILNGATGLELWRMDRPDWTHVMTYPDFNNDGHVDLFENWSTLTSVIDGEHLMDARSTIQYREYIGDTALAGDFDLDGFDEVLVLDGDFDSNQNPINTNLFAISFLHGLYSSAETLSISSGVPLSYRIDFSRNQAGHFYSLLISGSGTQATWFNDFWIPLTWDSFLASGLNGNTPQGSEGFKGRLDAGGNASATLAPTPSLTPLVGRTFWASAVVYEYLGAIALGRVGSFEQKVRIIP